MQSNHHEVEGSDAKTTSDVHQSCSAVSGDQSAEDVAANEAVSRREAAAAGSRLYHAEQHEGTLAKKSHVGEECSARRERQASKGSAENDDAVDSPVVDEACGVVRQGAFEARRCTTEALLRDVWPSGTTFEWQTPCGAVLTKTATRVGRVARSASREEKGKKSHKRRLRTARGGGGAERKRLLIDHLKQSGQSIVQLLQGRSLVIEDAEERRKWLEHIERYATARRDASEKGTKQPRVETGLENSSQRAAKSRKRDRTTDAQTAGQNAHHGDPELLLRDLIDAGLLEAKDRTVTFSCDDTTYQADLKHNGHIYFRGRDYRSAKDFVGHILKNGASNAAGDDVWTGVIVAGQSLDVWQRKLLAHASSKHS